MVTKNLIGKDRLTVGVKGYAVKQRLPVADPTEDAQAAPQAQPLCTLLSSVAEPKPTAQDDVFRSGLRPASRPLRAWCEWDEALIPV